MKLRTKTTSLRAAFSLVPSATATSGNGTRPAEYAAGCVRVCLSDDVLQISDCPQSGQRLPDGMLGKAAARIGEQHRSGPWGGPAVCSSLARLPLTPRSSRAS
ncbi:hypothetical protein Sxan_22500 [Streptomyces xanthophaeus]|uniref:Uncharacterized protein n=1 Tax=Streptomyces xanthophaeus TaxID=67385 RepID=A0A919GUQ1_9ACTN|nr:hypothetical protein Sxan_22500 [Streptomyces xanthophaeus]